MQFKEIGNLFGKGEFASVFNGGGLKANNFKTASSIRDMENITAKMFNKQFHIGDNGISEWNKSQIEAKANAIGLTDSLKNEVLAMASDADMTDKLRSGKLTWSKAIDTAGDSLNDVGDALIKTGKLTDVQKEHLEKLMKAGETDKLKNAMNGIVSNSDELSKSFANLGKNSGKISFFDNLKSQAKGAVVALKSVLPILAAVGVAYGAYKLWDYSQTGYTRASKKLDKSSGEYETTKSELNSLNSQLDETKSRIEELQSMKKDGTITVADEAELSKLQQQNSELERQVALKESLAKKQAEVVAKDAKKVSETGQTYTEAMREKYGAVKGTLMGIIGNYKDPTLKDANGNMSKSAAEAWSEENGGKDGKATIEQQMKANIKKLKDYKKDLKKAQKEKNQADVDAAQENIDEISKTLSSESSTIQGWIDASKDANGNIIKSMRGSVREWNSILTDYQNIDLTKAQKNYNNLENYFNSSAGSSMKSYLEDIVKNGGSAQDALDAFRESGMRLNDIGVNSSTFLKYFEEVKKSAEEAADAVDQVDGSFDGMKTASESANQGVNYDSTMGYYKTAKEAYSKGLWGTDDFQTVAQFAVGYDISKKLKENADAYTYASDAYKEAWENGGSQLMERWYGNEDELVNMTHVLEDFKNAGLASSNGNGEWLFKNSDGSMKFKTTAEAAEKLHTSVDNVEVAMSKLEEHGFEFDGIEKSGKLLNDYKDNLDGLKTIYDSLNEGDDKDRIGKLIEGYDSEYEKFQDDMSGLSEDQVVKIKFEYDLATLKQQIQDLKETAYATGDNQDWAAVTVSQKQAIDKLEKQTGVNADNDKGYSGSKDKIKELRSGMKGATEDERAAINEQISAIQTLEQNYLDFKNQGGKLNWEDYLNTAEATKAFEEISENGSLTVDDLKSLFGDGVTIEYTAEIKNEAQLEEKLNSLKNGESITFEAKVDDAETAVRAIKNEDGTITYKADIGGVEQDVDKIVDKDGNIRYTAEFDGSNIDWLKDNLDKEETIYFDANVDGATEKIAAIKDENGEIKYIGVDNGVQVYLSQVQNADGSVSYTIGSAPTKVPDANGVSNYGLGNYPKSTPDVNGTANYRGNFPTSAPTITGVIRYTIQKVGSAIASAGEGINKGGKGWRIAGGGFNGTAHVLGSAYSSGNWGINKSETALVGELGTETIVRNGKFFTVGDNGAEFAHIQKGDIIFNHKQTEELFKNGYVTSGGGRAKIYGESFAYGTAYASGGRLPSSTSSKKKNTSSNRSSKKSNTSKAKSSSGSNTKSNSNSKSSESAEKSEELLDWIETLLSRTSRLTELATSAVDRAVGLANKQNALVDAVTKTQNEITTNQNAANKYFAQANSLGLAQGYVDKIKNGTLDIESITDDNLKEKISKYKDYYEKGLSAQDKVLDLQDKLNELYQKRLEIIEKEYDTIVEVNDSLKDMFDAKISYNSAYGMANDNQDNIDSINKSIKAQEDTFNQLTKKFDEYQKEVNSQIASGVLKQGSEDYRSAQKNLNDFTANIYRASQELIELQDKLVKLRVDAIQTIIDTFQRRSDKLDKYASLLEAKDETVPESVYQERLDNNNDTIRKNQEARAIWLQRQATEDVNSDNYKKYAEEIQKLDESTLDLMKDNEDLKNSIYSLRIKNLEDAIKGYDDLETELKGFRDLLNDDAFLDKNGGITDEGLAQITLLSQSIGNAKQKISDLTTGLQKVKELYDNGVISLKEYNEKSAEYRKELQSSTSDVKSYQKSLTDLYQNALKTEVDALQKVIDKRKSAQSALASYYDFQKKITSQTNDVNSLKAQIAALEGVNDAATLAKKKKLEEQLRDAQQTLDDTKRDHRNDLISKGYDQMSQDLSDLLEDTEYEISHNADKQNEIIQSMLDKQVGMYQEAYSKINSIIKNTGWVGSNDFNNNQSQMSSQTGAQNQASNASQTQQTANSKPSGSASGTDTSGIKDNSSENNKITENIMKPENTTNRPVAELKVSSNSVSIEEGKSTSVTATVRPNDAANKTLTWKSSNDSVATVSNGTISGKKPGSCQVTVSTTDGSGLSQTIGVTVTKKPDPPKPAPAPVSSGGDGIARVGDVVTFTGSYYYDSWGKKPAGNLYSGVKNGVVIDSYSSKDFGGNAKYTGNLKVHIKSADGRYGNLGWVGLNQISGYATGTLGVDKDQIAVVDENGRELVVPNPKAGRITKLEKGTGVIPNPATEKLVNMTNNLDNNGNMVINGRTIEEYVNDMANMQSIAVPDFSDVTASVVSQLEGKGMGNVTLEYNQPVTFNSVDKNDIPAMEEFLKKSCDYTMKAFAKDLRKKGFRITR